MLLNRATNSTEDIYSKIYNDKAHYHHDEEYANIRHSGKSRGSRIPFGRSIARNEGIHHVQEESTFNRTSSWIDGLLGGKSKQGVFTADFLDDNGTVLTVRDGETALLNCSIYLRHNKTVMIS